MIRTDVTRVVYAWLLLCVCLSLIAVSTVYADWASSFVVHNGSKYTITTTTVMEDQIGPQVGKVTKYSDVEGTYRGNFSNTFPKGTPYFAIHDTSEDEGIAVRTIEGGYVLASYDGEYAEAAIWTSVYFWIGVIAVVLVLLFAAVRLSNPRKKEAG